MVQKMVLVIIFHYVNKKGMLLKGGVTQSPFITGKFLPDEIKGKTFDEYLLHTTDWYLTLLHASGLSINAKINEENENNNNNKSSNKNEHLDNR